MNIIEAFKTGKKVECDGMQWDTSSEGVIVELLAKEQILSDDWDLVTRDDEKKSISRDDLKRAFAKKGFGLWLAEAVADELGLGTSIASSQKPVVHVCGGEKK